MKPPELIKDERDEVTVLTTLEIMQLLEDDPWKRPAKVIPWPKSIKSPDPKTRAVTKKLIAADHTPGG